MAKVKRWTEAEDNALRFMLARGSDDQHIGEALGRTACAIQSRRMEIGATRYRKKGVETPEAVRQTRLEVPEAENEEPIALGLAALRQQIDGLNSCVASISRRIGDLTQIAAENEEALSNLKTILYTLEGWASKPALKRGKYERSEK